MKGKESFLKESVLREIIVSMERSISWINAASSRRGVTFILSFIFIVFHGMHIFMQRAHWKATVTFLKQIKEIWDLLLLSSLFSLKEKIKVKFAKSHFLWSWAMAAFSWITIELCCVFKNSFSARGRCFTFINVSERYHFGTVLYSIVSQTSYTPSFRKLSLSFNQSTNQSINQSINQAYCHTWGMVAQLPEPEVHV